MVGVVAKAQVQPIWEERIVWLDLARKWNNIDIHLHILQLVHLEVDVNSMHRENFGFSALLLNPGVKVRHARALQDIAQSLGQSIFDKVYPFLFVLI